MALFEGDVSTWGIEEWAIIIGSILAVLLIVAIVLGVVYSKQQQQQKKKKNDDNDDIPYAPLQSPRQEVPLAVPAVVSAPYRVMDPEQMRRIAQTAVAARRQPQQLGVQQRRPIVYEQLPPSQTTNAPSWASPALPATPLPPRSATAAAGGAGGVSPIVYGRLPRQPLAPSQQRQEQQAPIDWMNARSPEEDLYGEVDMDLDQ